MSKEQELYFEETLPTFCFETLQKEDTDEVRAWCKGNIELFSAYRGTSSYLPRIYYMADCLLEATLGKDYSLPIDVRLMAKKCNLSIELTDFSEIHKERGDYTWYPTHRLSLRSICSSGGKIVGTIQIAENLGKSNTRFAIARALAEYVLRTQSHIGMECYYEPLVGLYGLVSSNELLVDELAYSIMLPYSEFLKLDEEYKCDNSRWPINFSEWLSFLRDRIQAPEFHILQMYQLIKRYTQELRWRKAVEFTPKWLCDIILWIIEELQFPREDVLNVLRYKYNGEDERISSIQLRLNETIDAVILGAITRDISIDGMDEWREKILHQLWELGVSEDEFEQASDLLYLPQDARDRAKQDF